MSSMNYQDINAEAIDRWIEEGWEYLQYARSNPVKWNVSTDILYGSLDNLQDLDTITTFANRINATLVQKTS